MTRKIKLIYKGPNAFRFSTSGFLNQKRISPKNKNIAHIVTRFTAFFCPFLKYWKHNISPAKGTKKKTFFHTKKVITGKTDLLQAGRPKTSKTNE